MIANIWNIEPSRTYTNSEQFEEEIINGNLFKSSKKCSRRPLGTFERDLKYD
jgi:hypothetical protein